MQFEKPVKNLENLKLKSKHDNCLNQLQELSETGLCVSYTMMLIFCEA